MQILNQMFAKSFFYYLELKKTPIFITQFTWVFYLHQIENRIKIFKSDVDNFNTGKYDLILSNPPYIEKHQLKYLGVSEFEPSVAFDGGINGIEILKKVILKSSKLLKINGKLIIEIGYNKKYRVKHLLNKKNFFINKIVKDFSGHDRCIISTKLL